MPLRVEQNSQKHRKTVVINCFSQNWQVCGSNDVEHERTDSEAGSCNPVEHLFETQQDLSLIGSRWIVVEPLDDTILK